MLFNLFVAFSFLGVVAYGQRIYTGPCGSYDGVKGNITKCNKDNVVPGVNDGVLPASIYLSYFSSVFPSTPYNAISSFFEGDTGPMCTEATKYKALARCVVNSYRHCADNDLKKLVPTAAAYEEAIDYVCANRGPIAHVLNCMSDSNEDCVTNREARENVKADTLGRSTSVQSIYNHWCQKDIIQTECIETDEDVLACVGTGTLAVSQELWRILKPMACGATSPVFAITLLIISFVTSYFL